MIKFQKTIANVIAKSLEHDFLDKKYLLGLESNNYAGFMKSDVINTNMRKAFDSDRYIVHEFKRSAWEGRLIIDLDTKCLISVTSISNLNHISKVKGRIIPHYMQTLLSCLNKNMTNNMQISMDTYHNFDHEDYEKDMSNIFNNLDIDFSEYRYYIVAYEYKYNRIIDMNWYLLGPEFNIVEKFSIMDLVTPDLNDLTMYEHTIFEESENKENQNPYKKGISLKLKKQEIKKTAN